MIRVIIEIDGQTEVSESYPAPFLMAGPRTARSVGEWLQVLIAQAQVSAAAVDPIKGLKCSPAAAELVGRSVTVCPSCGEERWMGYGPGAKPRSAESADRTATHTAQGTP